MRSDLRQWYEEEALDAIGVKNHKHKRPNMFHPEYSPPIIR